MNGLTRTCGVGSLLALSSFVAGASSTAGADEWRFNVSLDDKLIGYHRFQISERDAHKELLSEARFNVKFLFVTAYRYAHDSREQWRDGCLQQLTARTNANGEQKAVNGSQGTAIFRVTVDRQSTDLDPCVMTFAYWNPQMLEATRLLNPQTGEYVPVRISRVGLETLVVRGADRATERFRVLGDAKIGGRLEIDLWYSTDRQWLALESKTEDGRRLTYKLQ